MTLPTEPIGSIPRPLALIDGMRAAGEGLLGPAALETLYDDAVQDTLRRFEETGSPVVTDGEQRKQSFATYTGRRAHEPRTGRRDHPVRGRPRPPAPAPDVRPVSLCDAAWEYVDRARPHTKATLKQAVISASAVSLMYPGDGVPGYPREAFIEDLVGQAADEIRGCLDRGADVQIDFTEARLSLKLDPSGGLLNAFVDLNNQVLGTLTDEQRARVGVHTCPGGDQDSTHSADVPYEALLPSLFRLNVGQFYVQLASEADRPRVLAVLGQHANEGRRVFVGVIDPLDPRVETAEEVRDRVLEAARFIDPAHLGTTDDCGFSPFGDDTSTSRDIAFAKIQARVEGTELASQELGI
jgi:5-methyltetrahydropteroyltriglutamate--homocysteine methyltransferase